MISHLVFCVLIIDEYCFLCLSLCGSDFVGGNNVPGSARQPNFAIAELSKLVVLYWFNVKKSISIRGFLGKGLRDGIVILSKSPRVIKYTSNLSLFLTTYVFSKKKYLVGFSTSATLLWSSNPSLAYCFESCIWLHVWIYLISFILLESHITYGLYSL